MRAVDPFLCAPCKSSWSTSAMMERTVKGPRGSGIFASTAASRSAFPWECLSVTVISLNFHHYFIKFFFSVYEYSYPGRFETANQREFRFTH